MKIRNGLVLTALASQISSGFHESSKKHRPRQHQYHRQDSSYITDYISRAQKMVYTFKEKMGCPGMSVCVSLSGKIIYQEGVGYANVEHMVPVNENTVFRIASISKPFTSLLVGRLLDQRKLDLDEDIRSYLPEFPEKIVNETYVYPEMLNTVRFNDTLNACDMFKNDTLVHLPGIEYTYSTFAFTLLSAVIEKICLNKGSLFDQPLATVKGESKSSCEKETKSTNDLPKWARFDTNLLRLFQYLNLNNTCLEYPEKIISSRAAQYCRSDKGILTNTPTIDNSYKWAGGGILSTASDLIRLADHLAFIYMGWLESYGIVKQSTLNQLLWKVSCVPPDRNTLPGLGWFLARRSGDPATEENGYPDRLYALHTGGAVGGTTVLLLSLPLLCNNDNIPNMTNEINTIASKDNNHNFISSIHNNTMIISPVNKMYPVDVRTKAANIPPINVAILTNLENVSGISELAINLSELFLDYAIKLEDLDDE
ncbi:family S12 unassigned peptidase (S12 family) [Schistosoma mansoni]|uniref:family S12 unassigned peptidase (S12 family) n=1 Tax=Schistosoma mansoni TaxID=6183 RepID=UPI00022DC26E|nr:family S12 unassigned peptidase (S12 family) [Schistosoma mansoni]|eukprot:XP_018648616.1 family S12 unassigned peptidase (S12 family) [Schistosoma mansoni]